MPTPRFTIIAALVMLLPAAAAGQQGLSPDAIRERYAKLHEKWKTQAEQLIKKLEADGQSDDAAGIRKLIEPVAATPLISIPVLATTGQPSEPPAATTACTTASGR